MLGHGNKGAPRKSMGVLDYAYFARRELMRGLSGKDGSRNRGQDCHHPPSTSWDENSFAC